MKDRKTDESAPKRDHGELDEKRMITSGAWQSGYHPPSEEDVDDIRKDHSTHSGPGAVSADEAIREVNGTAGTEDGGVDQTGHEADRTKKNRRRP